MSEMIERVAKAIHKAIVEDRLVGENPDDCPDIARAAIEAMREPSEEKRSAPGKALVSAGDYTMHCGEAENAWRAMIDAALAEP